jgi:hypothetical protein
MAELSAITNQGLEGISSDEMGRLPGLQVSQVSYRRVSATYTGELARLLGLRTVDDVFLDLAAWDGTVPQRSALVHLTPTGREAQVGFSPGGRCTDSPTDNLSHLLCDGQLRWQAQLQHR